MELRSVNSMFIYDTHATHLSIDFDVVHAELRALLLTPHGGAVCMACGDKVAVATCFYHLMLTPHLEHRHSVCCHQAGVSAHYHMVRPDHQ